MRYEARQLVLGDPQRAICRHGANILGVFSTNSRSHWLVYNRLIKAKKISIFLW